MHWARGCDVSRNSSAIARGGGLGLKRYFRLQSDQPHASSQRARVRWRGVYAADLGRVAWLIRSFATSQNTHIPRGHCPPAMPLPSVW